MSSKIIKAKNIIDICNGKLLTGNENTEINTFARDTREITIGDMFIAIKGEVLDGNNFVETAFENGAIGAIVDSYLKTEIIERYKEKVIIKVNNSIEAIQKLAKYKRSLYNIPVVAITGSVGKTSTKDIVANILSAKYNVLKTEGNYNNHIGLPLTLLKLKEEHTAIVLEMGMNHFGEIKLLTDIAKPTICVITNIGTAHIGNLGSRENILKAKLEILEGLQDNGKIVINNDNDLLNKWAENSKHNIYTYGIDNKSLYMAYKIEDKEDGNIFNIDISNKKYNVKVPTPGMHFVYNALCGITIGKILEIDEKAILNKIETFELTSKRMEVHKLNNNITILNDSYNASYDSVKGALQVLNKMNSNRKIAVLGDMLELGDFSEQIHLNVGEEVVNNKIDILITVGNYSKYIAQKAKELGLNTIYICSDVRKASDQLNKVIKDGDTVLLKASNAINLSKILDNLRK